ncbi:serine/threonine-protein kinase [Corallococcus llansteffanensis]|uniref:Serine/threonine protein kinase n=1 Tax=Corallococcus llansteffanensis TaxID=2316731 RepID=A0A3A8P1S0_9BACT|nr:serine/threonine-protein kinase [Corallococcus llansteffanensis]RKH46352.1 serine/threonine protein kinase [Corallococcus llansteffanensis]
MTTTQSCPNCGTVHDTRVYVSGQKVVCRCGIRFEVRRADVSGIRTAEPSVSRPPVRAEEEPGVAVTFVPRTVGNPPESMSPSAAPGVGEGREDSRVGQETEPRDAPSGAPVMAGPPLEPVRAESVAGSPGGTAMAMNVLRPDGVGKSGEGEVPVALAPAAEEGPRAHTSHTSGVALPSSEPAPADASLDGETVLRPKPPAAPQPRPPLDTGFRAENAETVVSGAKPRLPGLELLEVLGRGGMGEVWLARQQSLGRTVAVKVLPPRLAKDAEFVSRFDKEATALAALSHPNIVQIIDRGVEGEHYYFVMEYVEGQSLRHALSGADPLPPQQVLKILLQVARAVEAAHDKNIIHRDLKPENILLDGRLHAKVADFGLAGIRQPDSVKQLTATAVAMGTLNYMAPEQRRDAKNVDGRADLFSLGVMMYEALTGELPVGRFKLPSQRVRGMDPRVDPVVERLLETDREARYATATEVCEALEALVSSTSSPHVVAPASELARRQDLAPAGRAASGPEAVILDTLHAGWGRVRTGLSVVGGLALLGFAVRAFVGPVSLHLGQDDKYVLGSQGLKVKPGQAHWPPNTEGEVFAGLKLTPPTGNGTASTLEVGFTEGTEEINVHSGDWRMVDGELQVQQGGMETDGDRLVPRAYLAHRYFTSDDFTAEVLMDVKPLGREFSVEEDGQHFGELAFRIRDVQVSVFAIPDVGMRLSWRYFSEDGREVVGNSADDTRNLVGDEMPLPRQPGPLLVRLQLKKQKNGVRVDAFLNKKLFASKMLPGFEGRVGKLALGCRNLKCTFDDLKVVSPLQARPVRRVATGAE